MTIAHDSSTRIRETAAPPRAEGDVCSDDAQRDAAQEGITRLDVTRLHDLLGLLRHLKLKHST